jgi:hypothetical protein
MMKRLTTTLEYREQAGDTADRQPSLSLAWHVDPKTGKPAARWVLGAMKATENRKLAAVA